MSEIVNLNKIRKQRQRIAGNAAAQGKRAQYGLGKQTRNASRRERAAQRRELDGKRLEDPEK